MHKNKAKKLVDAFSIHKFSADPNPDQGDLYPMIEKYASPVQSEPVPAFGKGDLTAFKFPDGKYYIFDKWAKKNADDLIQYAKKHGYHG